MKFQALEGLKSNAKADDSNFNLYQRLSFFNWPKILRNSLEGFTKLKLVENMFCSKYGVQMPAG